MFRGQPLSIVGGKAVGLREEPGPGHPVGFRAERPRIHFGAGVQFLGLSAIAEGFFLVITGDEALVVGGAERREIVAAIRRAAAGASPEHQNR